MKTIMKPAAGIYETMKLLGKKKKILCQLGALVSK
jgi:hypothetical protein